MNWRLFFVVCVTWNVFCSQQLSADNAAHKDILPFTLCGQALCDCIAHKGHSINTKYHLVATLLKICNQYLLTQKNTDPFLSAWIAFDSIDIVIQIITGTPLADIIPKKSQLIPNDTEVDNVAPSIFFQCLEQCIAITQAALLMLIANNAQCPTHQQNLAFVYSLLRTIEYGLIGRHRTIKWYIMALCLLLHIPAYFTQAKYYEPYETTSIPLPTGQEERYPQAEIVDDSQEPYREQTFTSFRSDQDARGQEYDANKAKQCRKRLLDSDEKGWQKRAYKELGVDANASLKEIHTAYLNLVRQYHPDQHPSYKEKFKSIGEAYARIKLARDI